MISLNRHLLPLFTIASHPLSSFKFKFNFSVTDSKNNVSSTSSDSAHFYNYQNDIYCMNMNGQQSNQFLSYQNYHHDQLMHQQYFDENPHAQNYNFVPYSTNETYVTTATSNDPVQQQENFPPVQTNELYEFLPEEIFQLDQPIVKSESQPFNVIESEPIVSTMETLHLPFTTHSSDITSSSHSFLDLSSGQIQTNVKYPMAAESFSSEINNNYNQPVIGMDHSHKVTDVNAYSYSMSHEASARLNCAVESEKVLKRKHHEVDNLVKQNPHQSFHLNQPLFAKRESSCLLQQSTSYYPPDLYANFPTKPNDVYRTMEKYNNYITNN